MTGLSQLAREYRAVRTGLSVTSITDMAIVRVAGDRCGALLDELLAGPVERLVENGILWTVMLDGDGRVAADVQLYNDFGTYLLTCRRGDRDDVLHALGENLAGVSVDDRTDELAMITVEGPDALELPATFLGSDAAGLPPLRFTHCFLGDEDVVLSRIGFSGEFAYQLFVPRDRVAEVRDRVFDAAPHAVLCSGEARDLLRLEMRLPNASRDFPRGETALQAGLHWMIHFRKPAFRGRDAVMAEKAAGATKQLVCFAAEGDSPVAPDAELFADGRRAGYVAHAAWSPAATHWIGVAYVDPAYAWVGVVLEDEGGRRLSLVSAPFVISESSRRVAQ